MPLGMQTIVATKEQFQQQLINMERPIMLFQTLPPLTILLLPKGLSIQLHLV